MRTSAALCFVLLSACNVYDGARAAASGGAAGDDPAGAGGVEPSGGAAGDGGAGGDPSSGGAAGSDIASGAGGSGTGASHDGGGAGGASVDEGSGGGVDAGGGGGSRGADGAQISTGAGGTGGSTGAGGTDPRDAGAPDIAIADAGGACEAGACKRVFASAMVPVPSGKLGGALAMDTFCQTSADAERLGGTWMAWISDATTSPAARFTHATVPYRLLSGVAIANDWMGLTSGTLLHAINVFEDGASPEAGVVLEVWTGTNVTGLYSGKSCANWTNDTASPPNADVGVTSQTNAGWTSVYQQFCDRTTHRVYCFEQ